MATKKEFQTYMEQNKANLNREALQGANMDMVYNEWKDTGSIGKNYMAQPKPVTTQTNPIQTPEQAKQGLNVLTPEQLKAKNLGQPQTIQQEQPKPVNQQIPNQIDQTQPLQTTTTKSEPLPQTIAPKTMPVTEIKPGEAPTLETPKYQSQIDNFLKTGSIAEARNKLKEGLNAGVIDKATYDKGETYLWQQVNQKQQEGIKGDEERMRVEEEQRKMQMDPNNLFNSIRTGQSVSQEIKNSPEYKRQQERVNRLNQFENMSPSDLYYAMTNGQLFNGTETYNDLKNVNPGLVRQAEQLMSLNSALSTRKSSVEETRESISKAIIGKMTDSEVTDLKGIISQNPEVVSLNDKLAQSKTELDDLKDSIDNMEEDLMRQLSGTGATKGYIQAKASKMNRDLIRQYNAKLNEYNTTAGQLQTITENIKYEIGLQEQRKAKELQALQFAYGIASDELNHERGLEAEQRARQFQLEDRAYNEELQTRQLEQRYAYEYGDLNSENPTLQNIAIERAVGSMYENYPIPGMESQSVKVQKVKNLMDQGMTGTQAITQVENEIRNSQRYKDYLASQAPQTKTTQPIKMGEDSLYDPNTGKWLTKPSVSGVVTSGTTQNRPDRNNNPGNLKAGDVGYGVDDQNHTIFGSAEEGYKAMIKDITAKMTGNTRTGLGPNSTLAQLGKVYAEDPNWAKAVSKLSGYSLNTKLSEIDVNKLAPAIAKQEGFTGTINQTTQDIGKQYTDNDIALLGSVTKLDKQGKETLRDNGYTEKEWANFNAGLLPPTKRQKADAKIIVDKVNDIFSGDWTDAVGVGLGKSRIWTGAGTDRKVTEIKVASLKDLLAMANLDKIKGAMSDKDIEFLRNTATSLSTDLSEDEFEKTLNEIKNKYAGIYGGTTTVDTTGTSTQISSKSSDDDILNYLKNKTNPNK